MREGGFGLEWNGTHPDSEGFRIMDPKARTVLDAALDLPEGDRAAIAQSLLATLSPDVDEMDDEELLAELDRRSEEARRDPSATISWEELRDALRAPEDSR